MAEIQGGREGRKDSLTPKRMDSEEARTDRSQGHATLEKRLGSRLGGVGGLGVVVWACAQRLYLNVTSEHLEGAAVVGSA